MSTQPRLQLRNGTYYIRVAIPRNLRPIIGKHEICKSLKTANRYEALRRLSLESAAIDAILCAEPSAMAAMLKETKERTTTPFIQPFYADALLDSSHKVVNPSSITLDALMQSYLDSPSRSNLKRKSRDNYATIFTFFKQSLGAATPVNNITREDCRNVRDLLLQLPSNAQKHFPDTKPQDIVKLKAAKNLPKLAPSNVNKYITNLSSLFSWAVVEEYMERNPAKALTVADNVKAADKRLPFSAEQLQCIFSQTLHDEKQSKASRFWIPLISLYTGMRLNEICQLEVDDIQTKEGISIIVVSDGERSSKQLKTEASRRIIPIHPKLIEAGLLEYHKQMKTTLELRLFPEIKMTAKGNYSDAFSKWFARHLIAINVKTDTNCFHSFRHNFRDALREAGISRDIAMALGGWSSNGGTEEIYGSGFSVQRMHEAIIKIEYDALVTG